MIMKDIYVYAQYIYVIFSMVTSIIFLLSEYDDISLLILSFWASQLIMEVICTRAPRTRLRFSILKKYNYKLCKKIILCFIRLNSCSVTLKLCITYRHKKVSLPQSRAVCHATCVDVIQVLQRGAALRRTQLHQRGRRLSTAQHEAEASPCAVQDHRAGFHVAIPRGENMVLGIYYYHYLVVHC